jgi:hypothetical protein
VETLPFGGALRQRAPPLLCLALLGFDLATLLLAAFHVHVRLSNALWRIIELDAGQPDRVRSPSLIRCSSAAGLP